MRVGVKPSKGSEGLCLCQATKTVLVLSRWTGLLPIVPCDVGQHQEKCKFLVSARWFGYTCTLLALYVPYVVLMYSTRLMCGPSREQGLEWYVVTFGYLFTDIESIVSLLTTAAYAKISCNFLEHLSGITSSETLKSCMQRNLKKVMLVLWPCVLCDFASYCHVAWLRDELNFGPNLCTLVDRPFAVVIRGATLIFPSVETCIMIMITMTLGVKYSSLAEATVSAINENANSGSTYLLGKAAEVHVEISSSLANFNKYFGLQLLMGVSTSLYMTIYYLYSFSSLHDDDAPSMRSTAETFHYLCATLYRSSKLLIYLLLGSSIRTNSEKPLNVLRDTSIINMPTKTQELIRTLILQWSGKKATLSGLDVINVGPWLLAPIIGNVITYLLVAIQLRKSGCNEGANATRTLPF